MNNKATGIDLPSSVLGFLIGGSRQRTAEH